MEPPTTATPPAGAYRTGKAKSTELEVEAFYELLNASKRLRMRTIFSPAGVALVFGTIGLIAHTTGAWSLLGRSADGSYWLTPQTALASLLLPFVPLVGGGWIVHFVLRRRLIRRWRAESMRKYHLSAEVLDERAKGLP